jgi:probable rRNA maturation factor
LARVDSFLRILEMQKKEEETSIEFHFLKSGFTLRDRKRLKLFLVHLFKKEGVAISSLQYIFCSDKYLLQINKDFLKHDYYTDIITFDLSDKGQPKIAEVYISVDRVKDNCKTLNEVFKQELHRVIFHGALHLCGYKDKRGVEKKEMRKKEDAYLKSYFK